MPQGDDLKKQKVDLTFAEAIEQVGVRSVYQDIPTANGVLVPVLDDTDACIGYKLMPHSAAPDS